MKKRALLLSLVMAMTIALPTVVACTDAGNSGGPQQEQDGELKEGVISVEARAETVINQENSGRIVATASNGAPIKFALAEGEEATINSAFGGKLGIAEDGTITGKYDALKNRKIKIVASAEKCPDVTVSVNIYVVNPYLTFEGKTLVDAKKDVPYAASVAYVQEANDIKESSITYTIVKGKLPTGLTMNEDGLISGTPTTVGRAEPFTVRATVDGYSATDAVFAIDVIINHESSAPSKIVNFGKEGEITTIESAFVEGNYVNQSGIVGKAAALNGNNMSYQLAQGSTLPEGLTLYPNGAIFGKANVRGNYEFDVVVSAEGCAPVTRRFKLSVIAAKIKFTSVSGTITKGENANFSIANADAGEGVAITYSVDEANQQRLAAYGLSLTSDGKVTGAATKSVKQMSFEVIAEAEDMTPNKATMYFRIKEPMQQAADNKFEAEYIDLDGKAGTGWSASPTNEGLIDKDPTHAPSGGAFVNYLHNDNVTLEFVIYAEQDANNVPLFIGMSSEMGTVNLTPSAFRVLTFAGETPTGTGVAPTGYSSVRVNGGNKEYADFAEYQFGTVNLKQGYNVIQLAIMTNTLREGLIGGPGVDYIRLNTTTKLTWSPCTYNMD